MKFSIIVLSHQRWSFLKQAMHSIESQTFRDFDVLVVDSGSMVHEIRERYASDRVSVVASGEPEHLSKTACPTSWVLNRFVPTLRGTWITCLCDDDLLMQSYLESFDKVVDNGPFPACAYTGQLRVVTDAGGGIRKVKKTVYANRKRGPWFVDCHIDYLQFAFNRWMWHELTAQHGKPFPEELETADHPDGVFIKRATAIARAVPAPGVHCINRRHPGARFAGVT